MNQYKLEYALLERIIATEGCTLDELFDTLKGLSGSKAEKLAALDHILKSLAIEQFGNRYCFRHRLHNQAQSTTSSGKKEDR